VSAAIAESNATRNMTGPEIAANAGDATKHVTKNIHGMAANAPSAESGVTQIMTFPRTVGNARSVESKAGDHTFSRTATVLFAVSLTTALSWMRLTRRQSNGGSLIVVRRRGGEDTRSVTVWIADVTFCPERAICAEVFSRTLWGSIRPRKLYARSVWDADGGGMAVCNTSGEKRGQGEKRKKGVRKKKGKKKGEKRGQEPFPVHPAGQAGKETL